MFKFHAVEPSFVTISGDSSLPAVTAAISLPSLGVIYATFGPTSSVSLTADTLGMYTQSEAINVSITNIETHLFILTSVLPPCFGINFGETSLIRRGQ